MNMKHDDTTGPEDPSGIPPTTPSGLTHETDSADVRRAHLADLLGKLLAREWFHARAGKRGKPAENHP